MLFLILRYIVAILLTFYILPGTGHLFLGQYKKGAIIIGVTLLSIVVISIVLLADVDMNIVRGLQGYEALYKYLLQIVTENKDITYFSDIFKALILSYSACDIIFMFIKDYKTFKQEQDK
ncbi:MAG: hypothetical protein LBC07_03840 [Elusimicrobiota bacterium]|jgi:hypothetical protein|nr:hypothetical protein [Elusimicrobiota bacterium]